VCSSWHTSKDFPLHSREFIPELVPIQLGFSWLFGCWSVRMMSKYSRKRRRGCGENQVQISRSSTRINITSVMTTRNRHCTYPWLWVQARICQLSDTVYSIQQPLLVHVEVCRLPRLNIDCQVSGRHTLGGGNFLLCAKDCSPRGTWLSHWCPRTIELYEKNGVDDTISMILTTK